MKTATAILLTYGVIQGQVGGFSLYFGTMELCKSFQEFVSNQEPPEFMQEANYICVKNAAEAEVILNAYKKYKLEDAI